MVFRRLERKDDASFFYLLQKKSQNFGQRGRRRIPPRYRSQPFNS